MEDALTQRREQEGDLTDVPALGVVLDGRDIEPLGVILGRDPAVRSPMAARSAGYRVRSTLVWRPHLDLYFGRAQAVRQRALVE